MPPVSCVFWLYVQRYEDTYREAHRIDLRCLPLVGYAIITNSLPATVVVFFWVRAFSALTKTNDVGHHANALQERIAYLAHLAPFQRAVRLNL